MRQTLFLLIASITVALSSCFNDKEAKLYPEPPCDTMNVHYSSTIKPIMDNSCAIAGCHNANTPSKGYNLSSYTDVQRAANNGALVGSVLHDPGFTNMPLNAQPLPDCEISQLKAWVNAGAPNN